MYGSNQSILAFVLLLWVFLVQEGFQCFVTFEVVDIYIFSILGDPTNVTLV